MVSSNLFVSLIRLLRKCNDSAVHSLVLALRRLSKRFMARHIVIRDYRSALNNTMDAKHNFGILNSEVLPESRSGLAACVLESLD